MYPEEHALGSPLRPAGGPAGISPKPWGIPAILLALALPLLLWGSSLAITITQGSTDDLTRGEVAAGLVLTIVLDIVLISLAAGLSIWRYHLGRAELGLRPFDRDLWWLPLAAAAAAHAGVIIYAVVISAAGGPAPKQETEELFDFRLLLPLAGVATVIFAPLAEEIFFRGFVFAGLLRPFGPAGAMLASGVVFGTFHITSADTVGLIVPFSAIGVLLAWVYYRTGSLWPSIGTHVLFNLVSFAALAARAGS
jgi:membrane protease YdiL (CAAX protease family)